MYIDFNIWKTDELLAEFVKYSKTIKNISIESVGLDDVSFKLMYASKKYLNMMEKQFVDNYLNLKKRKNCINKIL